MRTNFKTFLYEDNHRQSVSITQAKEFAIKNCSEAIEKANNDVLIYRGVRRGEEDFYVIDPTSSVRRSANTSNYYTLLISEAKEWSEFPKREHSIICSLDSKTPKHYGNSYIVLPFDNANIGIASADDFWNSFDETLYDFKESDLAKFNLYLEKFIYRVYLFEGLDVMIKPDRDAKTLLKTLHDVEDFINADRDEIKKYFDGSTMEKFNNYLIDSTLDSTLFDALTALLDPTTNKIIHKPISMLTANDKNIEVWTDSKALLVNEDIFWDFITKTEQ